MTEQMRYMSLNPYAVRMTPSIIGPIPVPRSVIAVNVETVTPYLCAGLVEIASAWHTEYTNDIPYPMKNPETRNRGRSLALAKRSMLPAKRTKPNVIMPFGPLVS